MNKRVFLIVVACLVVFLTACHIIPVSFREGGNIAPTPSTTEDATATPLPTLTETPTPEPTKTPELGGSEVGYLYDNGGYIPMPEGVKSLLTPSSPETWAQQTGLQFTDGTPYPWGEPVVEGQAIQFIVDIPSLVRGVIEIPEPNPQVGGKRLFVVLEVPAHGGSNFVILNLQDNIYATYSPYEIVRLPDGKVPLDWAQSSWEHPMSDEKFLAEATFDGYRTGREIAEMFKQHIGQMVMVGFAPSNKHMDFPCLRQVVEGTLINQNGQSGVDAINQLVSLILP